MTKDREPECEELQKRWDSLPHMSRMIAVDTAWSEAEKHNKSLDQQKLVHLTQRRLLKGVVPKSLTPKDVQEFIILNPYGERPLNQDELEIEGSQGGIQFCTRSVDSSDPHLALMWQLGRVLGRELEAWECDIHGTSYLYFKPHKSDVQCLKRLDIMWLGGAYRSGRTLFDIDVEVSEREPDEYTERVIDEKTGMDDPLHETIGYQIVAGWFQYEPVVGLSLLWDNGLITSFHKEGDELSIFVRDSLQDAVREILNESVMSVARVI